MIVGDVGLGLRRADLYEKEIDLLIPRRTGRAATTRRTRRGPRLPVAYVRWTENRNMEESGPDRRGRAQPRPLCRRTLRGRRRRAAYEALGGEQRPLLVLLSYPGARRPARRRVERGPSPPAGGGSASRSSARARSPGRCFCRRCSSCTTASSPRRRQPHRRDREGVAARTGRRMRPPSRRGPRRPGDRPGGDRDAPRPARRSGAPGAAAPASTSSSRSRSRSTGGARCDRGVLAAATTAAADDRLQPALLAGVAAARERCSARAAGRRLPDERRLHPARTGCTGRRAAAATSARPATSTTSSSRSSAAPRSRPSSAQSIRPDGRICRNDNFVATIRYADGSVCTLTTRRSATATIPRSGSRSSRTTPSSRSTTTSR